MKRWIVFACIAVGCVSLCWAPYVWSCSEINLTKGNYKVSSRNADLPFYIETFVVQSPRGVQRTSLKAPAGDTPLSWTAKYGSIGINFFGSDSSSDGINEMGLLGAILEQEDSKYPTTQSDQALSMTYWLQYYLDTCQTVEEAVAAAPNIKIYMPPGLPIELGTHLILHDPSGDAAVMEYDGSKNLNIYRPNSVGSGPADIYNGVITNEPLYPQQIANLLNYKPWGGALDLPGGDEPNARFVRGSWCLQQMLVPANVQQAIGYAFNYAQYIVEPAIPTSDETWPTYWTTLRDLDNLVYYFNTLYNPDLKSVTLGDLDFTAGQSIKMQNIEIGEGGDVSNGFIAAAASADGKLSYKTLSINPHNLVAGSRCNYTIYLGNTISQKFDLYILADTPFGVYTIRPNGSMETGIHAVLKNVPGMSPRTTMLPVLKALPNSLAGQSITFYIAAVQAGKIPPVAKLSDLSNNTPYVIMMDRETMTVK